MRQSIRRRSPVSTGSARNGGIRTAPCARCTSSIRSVSPICASFCAGTFRATESRAIGVRRNALQGLTILDIGCGAGILSEPLARLGARMTAIDPARRNIEVAKDHAAKTNLAIDYRCLTAEELAAEGAIFDVVLAMEVVEHVRDVGRFLIEAAAMVRPGGMLAAATLNRTLKSFAFAIVGAEYVLRWVPRGTHNWNQFVAPRELAKALRGAGLRIEDETGVVYDPLTGKWRLSHDMDINYIIAASRPE